MKNFCLTKEVVQTFKKKLKNGEVDPQKLAEMPSKDRHAFFSDFMGDANAKEVNALFESKMLLKNQKQGYLTWAKEVAGLKAKARTDIVNKINKLDKVLNPEEEEKFLADLAAQKLGAEVTFDEVKKITELAKKTEELRVKAEEGKWKNEKDRIEYGNALIDLLDYKNSLDPIKHSLGEKVINVVNLPKGLMASLDFSAPFRQGWGLMGQKEFWGATKKMFQYGFSEKEYKDGLADIISHPMYEKAKSAGLRITKLSDKLSEREEDFQSSLLDKIPGFRGSERAFSGFLNKVRFDVFKSLVEKADALGEDVTKGSKVNKDIASMINNFSGSGDIGTGDKYKGAVPFLNTLFFSPRKIAATINMFNPKTYLDTKISKIAKQEALKNLLISSGASALVLGFAAMMGAKVETNPQSSDFGKAVIGNTRYDVTGGNGTYAVLLARLLTNKTKSTTSDIVRDLGDGFGSQTRYDTALRFFRNKLSPAASFVANWLAGSDTVGTPFNMKNEVVNRMVPLLVSGTIQTVMEDPQNAVAAPLFSIFGIGVQTYSSKTDWSKNPGKELQQFRDKVGDEKFKQANEEYNAQVKEKIKEVQGNEAYKSLSEQDKQYTLSGIKDKVKNSIFKDYKFTYKETKTEPNSIVDKLVNPR